MNVIIRGFNCVFILDFSFKIILGDTVKIV